jgi:hypothetical protein
LVKDLVGNKASDSRALVNRAQAVKDSGFQVKVAPDSAKVELVKAARAGPGKKDKAKGAPGQAMEAELEKDDKLRLGDTSSNCCPQLFSRALSSNSCPQLFSSA